MPGGERKRIYLLSSSSDTFPPHPNHDRKHTYRNQFNVPAFSVLVLTARNCLLPRSIFGRARPDSERFRDSDAAFEIVAIPAIMIAALVGTALAIRCGLESDGTKRDWAVLPTY